MYHYNARINYCNTAEKRSGALGWQIARNRTNHFGNSVAKSQIVAIYGILLNATYR
jgi:hypothetical protein